MWLQFLLSSVHIYLVVVAIVIVKDIEGIMTNVDNGSLSSYLVFPSRIDWDILTEYSNMRRCTSSLRRWPEDFVSLWNFLRGSSVACLSVPSARHDFRANHHCMQGY